MPVLKHFLNQILVMTCLFPVMVHASDPGTSHAAGGDLSLVLYRTNLSDAGLVMETGAPARDGFIKLPITRHGKLKFNTRSGYFEQISGGHLKLGTGLRVRTGTLELDSADLRLQPVMNTRDNLQIIDAGGQAWFTMDYGHFESDGTMFVGRYQDLRIGPALATHLNQPELDGFIIGYVHLETPVTGGALPGDTEPEGITSQCPSTEPVWPTTEGFDADIAMLKMDSINQVVRAGGRVALAPSAYFENIGNADVPWFAQFADTEATDPCCADQGDGVCAPYGNDQGGLLVYHLYRYSDGRLEQLGQSQVKHAFNSINIDTAAGSVVCSITGSRQSGRVVPQGCEDLYGLSTNADQRYLGPREEVIAHQGIWLRDGSIWDLTGPGGIGPPDGNCDYPPPHAYLYNAQVPCQAPAADQFDRLLSVPETALNIAGARYFMEAWYVVRDDINIMNSFGRVEISPSFIGAWTFPAAAPFAQGPVIDEFTALQDPGAQSLTRLVDSGEGQLRLSSSAQAVAPGQWQYNISLMNFDFDRAVDQLDIPVSDAVNVLSSAYFDGNDDAGDDWSVTALPGMLRFSAPTGAELKWGSLISFRFVADAPPNADIAVVGAAQPGDPDTLEIETLTSSATLQRDGFESP